ncbi:hypothetical protein GCK32_009160 [Trichostrongylus colubriformis]|uniref:Uncharacterized protein n=1 Tax=Trichostrongylus colubriformis TaxID=6319 RepID=A0AAN8F903_TRICO
MDDVYKMNYFVNQMIEEALDSLKKFEVIESLYQAAVDLLEAKYENKELLIAQLIAHLEKARARSKRMDDQHRSTKTLRRNFFLVNQLQPKGEGIIGALL